MLKSIIITENFANLPKKSPKSAPKKTILNARKTHKKHR